MSSKINKDVIELMGKKKEELIERCRNIREEINKIKSEHTVDILGLVSILMKEDEIKIIQKEIDNLQVGIERLTKIDDAQEEINNQSERFNEFMNKMK